MRVAALIVTAIFAIAGAVSFWPAPGAPLPLAPRGPSPQLPRTLAIAEPAVVPLVVHVPDALTTRDAFGGLEDPRRHARSDTPEGVGRRVVDVDLEDTTRADLTRGSQRAGMPLGDLASRTLAIDLPSPVHASPATQFVYVPVGDMEAGVVSRAISLAGRQIAGAVRRTGLVIRGVF